MSIVSSIFREAARLARIQGHSIRILDEFYSEQLLEFGETGGRIDPAREIEVARALVWPSAPGKG